MKIEAFEINDDGYIAEVYAHEENEVPEYLVTTKPPEGLYKPRWTGTEWVEGITQEEFDELDNQPRGKTQLEILQETVDRLVLDSLEGI